MPVFRLPFVLLACLALSPMATAQEAAAPIPDRSSYAVNAAAISAAMTYCMSRYGPLTTGSRSATCFSRARNVLAGFGLRAKSREIDQICRDPAEYNTCITPQIGRLVIALYSEFEQGEL